MIFSSLTFIFVFLPLVIIGYYLIDKKFRNIFLLLASIIFYAWGEPKFVFIMLAMCLVDYGIGWFIYASKQKKYIKKVFLIIGVVFNVSILFVFKYLNFVTLNIARIFPIEVTNIVLPIGISFFIFQMLSYLIDLYRDTDTIFCKNPMDLCLYISFFPQLIAGPIVRYKTVMNQIKSREESFDLFSSGVERFVIGLSKKILLSNNMAIIADMAFNGNLSQLSVGFAWLGALAYTFQIYFDFSGYSDMAIGLGRMFGFEFQENFNYPYVAKSITDFWRRWHISLSQWFRDYVYIVLGGDGRNKKIDKNAQIKNLFIVWLLTGIWHGANWTFILWGVGYFVLLVLEKKIKRENNENLLYRVFTFIAIVLLWVVFRSESLTNLLMYVKAMVGVTGIGCDSNLIYYAREYAVWLLIAIFAATPIFNVTKDKVSLGKNVHVKVITKSVWLIALISLLIADVSYLVMGYHNPFIYFNF